MDIRSDGDARPTEALVAAIQGANEFWVAVGFADMGGADDLAGMR